MAGFIDQINLVGKLLLLMAVGFLLRKIDVVKAEDKKFLTDLVLYVTLPCSIVTAFSSSEFGREGGDLWTILFVSVGIQFGSLILSKILYRKCEPSHQDPLEYATVVPNSGILGTPISEGLFGDVGVLLASIYLTPMRMVMWTFGMAVFTKNVKGKSLIKAITHPCIIAVAIGLVLMFFPITLPAMLMGTISAIGTCNTAISMILVGAIMVDMDIKLIFHKESIYFTLIRLVAIPLIVFFSCNLVLGGLTGAFNSGSGVANVLLGQSLSDSYSLIRNVCVILTAMPAGSTTPIMALKYGSDEKFGSAIVAITTVLSLLAIPIWCAILA